MMGSGSVHGMSVFALGMGVFFALSGGCLVLMSAFLGLPSTDVVSATIPASLAFSVTGMLGAATVRSLRAQEERLQRIEEQVRSLNAVSAEPTTETDRGRDLGSL